MSHDIYLKLRDFLDKLPTGFPTTESGVEVKILKKLFTPEQAKIAMKLSTTPEPVPAIAPRLGMDETQAAAMIEAMAHEGLIYRMRFNGQPFYMVYQFVVGIYEFHLNTLDRELAELMEEYLPHIGKSWESIKTKQLRVVPIGSSLSTASAVSTYDQVRELIKGKKLIAVAPCICQKEQGLMGNCCDRPEERCLVFDVAAQYYIENKLGRKIDEEELVSILKRGEEKALVLSLTNAKKIVNICMCCGCCCGVLRILKKIPKPAEHIQSAFYAQIVPDLCIVCGACAERCQMDAVIAGTENYAINRERCIGCGLCVTACPVDAITLKAKPEPFQLPDTIIDLHVKIAKDRGIFFTRSLD
jgi:Na+-translocating ferredoxin:NAD+ oxidoreductase subunit B